MVSGGYSAIANDLISPPEGYACWGRSDVFCHRTSSGSQPHLDRCTMFPAALTCPDYHNNYKLK
ncbi:hypothetical protein TERTU_0385 [Teredinibacter turnerae T7901]|uniref:Uncharacterized protein n=1 Tax=Teredinibacter turnerae (strain ATCC 39867 / T7901) TaxID=377629 RepID=C5BMC2_TERTT|nr:hypothetical protein TERTU_0385 [Teredinibacter turnerae T7901]